MQSVVVADLHLPGLLACCTLWVWRGDVGCASQTLTACHQHKSCLLQSPKVSQAN